MGCLCRRSFLRRPPCSSVGLACPVELSDPFCSVDSCCELEGEDDAWKVARGLSDQKDIDVVLAKALF
jgi:hypothetical protein